MGIQIGPSFCHIEALMASVDSGQPKLQCPFDPLSRGFSHGDMGNSLQHHRLGSSQWRASLFGVWIYTYEQHPVVCLKYTERKNLQYPSSAICARLYP